MIKLGLSYLATLNTGGASFLGLLNYGGGPSFFSLTLCVVFSPHNAILKS